MTSALGQFTQSANVNEQAFAQLDYDVKDIYSNKDPTTKSYDREYSFLENKVNITFQRIWKGLSKACGVDMTGTAVVTMQKRDTGLEERITQIIKGPTNITMAGKFPTVKPITIN